MIDFTDAFKLARLVANKQSVLVTIDDLELLWPEYQAIKGGAKFDQAALAKSGQLVALVAAATRTLVLYNSLIQDPTTRAQTLALVETIA